MLSCKIALPDSPHPHHGLHHKVACVSIVAIWENSLPMSMALSATFIFGARSSSVTA